MSSKFLIANWKENPSTEKEALKLFASIAAQKPEKGIEVIVCPPFIYLEKIADKYRRLTTQKKKTFALGAQDVFWDDAGAHTSEVGPEMLEQFGLQYVIIGHSERRREMGEEDAMINKKVKAALQNGLKVILCVGEAGAIRKKGIKAAEKYVTGQLKKDLVGIRNSSLEIKNLFIAYEPIWAIGSDKNDSPADACAMAMFIKGKTSSLLHLTSPLAARRFLPVLYGGSVNSKDVRDYVQCKEIDGALVGGASLKSVEWNAMVKKAGSKK